MSPENCNVFQALERGDFLKNSGILQLTKMGPFWGHLFAVRYTLIGWWDLSKKFWEVFVTTRPITPKDSNINDVNTTILIEVFNQKNLFRVLTLGKTDIVP